MTFFLFEDQGRRIFIIMPIKQAVWEIWLYLLNLNFVIDA
jgi:hypothetical protein